MLANRLVSSVALLLFVSGPAFAGIITSTLSTNEQIESSTALLNRGLGQIHPPVKISGWKVDAPDSAASTSFSIGDGRHGAFNPSTYLQFHSGVYNNDQIIRIDTDAYSDLQFTSFDLAAGWSILPVGSKALVIRSQSTVTVAGTIDCSGGDGENSKLNNTVVALGGVARCGGSAGGNGGTSTLAANPGDSITAEPNGGGRGGSAEGYGGAGGGAMGIVGYEAGNGALDTGSGIGSLAGVSKNDLGWTTEGGGFGGGGGGAYSGASVGDHASGAGGGAGGGIIKIYAGDDILVSGYIAANGGDGGQGLGLAGAGGGGGGGSVLIYSAGEIEITGPNDDRVNVRWGDEGVSAAGGGGVGAAGRVWATSRSGDPTYENSGVQSLIDLLADNGMSEFEQGTFSATSKLIDLGSKSAPLRAASLSSLGTGTKLLEIASDDHPFTAAGAVWVDASTLVGSSLKRYVRYRVTLDNQSASTPLRITSVIIDAEAKEIQNFDYGSCQLVGSQTPPQSPGGLLVIFSLPFFLALSLRLSRRELPAKIQR